MRAGPPPDVKPRRGWAVFDAAFAIAACALLVPADAGAHLGSAKLVWIDASADGAEVRVDLDPIDVAYALDLTDPDDIDPDALVARSDEVRAWVVRVFSVRSERGACAASAGEISVVDVEGSMRMARAIRVPIAFSCPAPHGPLVFRDDAFFDTDRQHEAFLRVGDSPTVLRAGRQELTIGSGVTSTGSTLATFLLEGALHMFGGYDHILFLLSLLLASGEVAARDGTKKALRDVALMVTAFTVGHSVTLVAAALDVVVLPSRLVESAIAGSIVSVAVWNVVTPEARVGLRWVAGAFGLIHGFGFSSVLRELVLPVGERVTALLAFNVGIEIAQLTIVAMVVPLLGWAGRRPWYRRAVVRRGSMIVGAVALYWLVTRALDL